MNVLNVLRLLADGEVHSGEEIGETLGVSRTAVWKQLQKLSSLGLQLSSVKGKGYQLPGGLELLQREKILAGMNGAGQNLVGEMEIELSIDSTHNRAMDRVREGVGSGYICLAEHQSAGRGRKGRAWVSPFGRNIYLSTVWEFNQGAAVLEGLSLAVGVAIARVINRLTDEQAVQLKWPNDVYWQGKKLAGILLEMSGDVSSECQVIVGVGLNVSMPAAEAEAIDQQWVSLETIVPNLSRNTLVAALLEELLPLLNNYHLQGFAAYKEEWEELDFFRDKEVEIIVGPHTMVGQAGGVSDSGALRLITTDGEQLIYGGEASARVSG